MKKVDLLQRIQDLENRVRFLETRPQYSYYPPNTGLSHWTFTSKAPIITKTVVGYSQDSPNSIPLN